MLLRRKLWPGERPGVLNPWEAQHAQAAAVGSARYGPIGA